MMEKILEKVSEITGVSKESILSKRKTSEICEARQIFMYLSKSLTGKSNKSIGIFLDRTQQNVSSQIIDFEQKLKIYKLLDCEVNRIKNAIIQL